MNYCSLRSWGQGAIWFHDEAYARSLEHAYQDESRQRINSIRDRADKTSHLFVTNSVVRLGLDWLCYTTGCLMASQKQNIVRHPSNGKASQPKLETYCHESTNSIAPSRDDMHTSTSIMLVCILHTTATDSCAPCLLWALGAQVAPNPSIKHADQCQRFEPDS